MPTDIAFTGHRTDATTNLMFYQARYYSPALGRFVSADTIVPGAGNPQAFNRYSYVNNNPVKYIDPSGHMAVCPDCGSGNSDEAINGMFKAFAQYGVHDGIFAEYYACVHAAEVARATHAPDADVGIEAARTAYARAMNHLYADAWGNAVGGAPTLYSGAMFLVAAWGGKDASGFSNGVPANLLKDAVGDFDPGNPSGGGSGLGGRSLRPNERIVIFESGPGSGKFRTYDPEGNSAQSLDVAGSPQQALRDAFDRQPRLGERYWETTGGQIAATGRYAYNDAAGSAGHVSVYGGNPAYMDPIEFIKIWTQKFFGP